MELKNNRRHWLLLRGLGRDKRHWGVFVEQFQQAFPDDSVTVVDTLGNGEFCHLQSPLTIADYTEHCRQQLSSLIQQPQPIHLVALSLGGMIALDWAQRYPQEIASITLINTSVANLTPWYQRIKLKSLVKLLLILFTRYQSKAIEKAILQQTSNLAVQDQILQQWQKYYQESHTSRQNLFRQLIAASRFSLSSKLELQPLVLTSYKDRLVSTLASLHIYHFLGGKIIQHSTAGHDLPLDDANWVIAQIRTFLGVAP